MPPGRPSKFTEEVRSTILEAVRRGSYFSVAAQAAGIGYTTFKRWMRAGRSKAPEHKKFRSFRSELKKAQAQAEQAHLANIQTAAETGSWQASAWYLERKHSKRWAKKETAPPSSGSSETEELSDRIGGVIRKHQGKSTDRPGEDC